MTLNARLACVTGADKGIGRQIAKDLARHGLTSVSPRFASIAAKLPRLRSVSAAARYVAHLTARRDLTRRSPP